mmetsp:Transcript_6181/g.16123  ORF Transcript_6181/g.16123 Transcript_6181/m.16123 type:complete len:175 (+) Transcript_6181:45-569(+)
MHSYWVRLNAVFFYGLNVLLGLAVMTWLSCLQQDLALGSHPRPSVTKMEMTELLSLRSHGGVDRALLSFDLEADLEPTFHWNLKQLFVFVLAEYTSKSNVLNQVILWDKIVETEGDAKLNATSAYIKYALVDQANELRNTTVDLYLVWDHMPVTGRLYMDRGFGSDFKLPTNYR